MSDALQYPMYGPKTLGQILDRVFHLQRANFKLFVGISAVPPATMSVSLGAVFVGIVIPFLVRLPKNPTPAQNAQMGFVVIPAMMSTSMTAALRSGAGRGHHPFQL